MSVSWHEYHGRVRKVKNWPPNFEQITAGTSRAHRCLINCTPNPLSRASFGRELHELRDFTARSNVEVGVVGVTRQSFVLIKRASSVGVGTSWAPLWTSKGLRFWSWETSFIRRWVKNGEIRGEYSGIAVKVVLHSDPYHLRFVGHGLHIACSGWREIRWTLAIWLGAL